MGGAGGTPEGPNLKNPAGIGGSREGLEGNDASNFNLPGWAAGDTFDSWLTRLPGGGAPTAGVGEPMATASTPGANAAPEPSTLASLGAGAPPPVYSMGAGNRTEAAARSGQFSGIQGPGVSGSAQPAGKTAEQLAAEQKAKGEEWVHADIPTAYWHQGDAAITAGAQPGGNYAGVYMPQGLTRSNAANYMDPGTMATMGGQPAQRAYKPGDTITGDPAAHSRMRRSLYDFNMANYNNPFGPQGNYTPPIPPSFLMGTGGG